MDEIKTDDYNGLGLENVKRQLELLYPGKHSLKISNEQDSFKVQITIEFMNRCKCIIVEDEPLAQNILKKYIADHPSLELVATCTDAFRGTS